MDEWDMSNELMTAWELFSLVRGVKKPPLLPKRNTYTDEDKVRASVAQHPHVDPVARLFLHSDEGLREVARRWCEGESMSEIGKSYGMKGGYIVGHMIRQAVEESLSEEDRARTELEYDDPDYLDEYNMELSEKRRRVRQWLGI